MKELNKNLNLKIVDLDWEGVSQKKRRDGRKKALLKPSYFCHISGISNADQAKFNNLVEIALTHDRPVGLLHHL